MRASQQGQVGGAGSSEVTGAFARLGWGVASNEIYDLGTDLLVFARDERLFDLGLVVGVQVKTGPTYFQEPVNDSDDALLGWWFRDTDRAHIDAWLTHGLPHLIVLHDLDNRTSYWEHVNTDTVLSTGKGAKVFVPIRNTVDEAHRVALLEVAATLRPSVSWEGSAWTGAASLTPRELLRHALIVPRLVAPHPNVGHGKPVSAEQALALVMQARIHDLERFATEHAQVPSLSDASASSQWVWRLVGALGHRLTTGEVDQLRPLVDDAPDAVTRAAATVAAAAGLVEDGRVDEAVPLLEEALARDEAAPVDHAWLLVQHARACAEVGRVSDAQAAAIEVQKIRLSHAEDVTATAIAGAAAQLLFTTTQWTERDVANVIVGGDTTANWWRRQTLAWGLAALTDRTFKTWARDTSITFGGVDQATTQLLAASLTANHVGDHQDWRYLTSLWGQDALLRFGRDGDSQAALKALDALRLAGDDAALKLAVRRLVADGPATAVTLAAAGVRLDTSTHSTAATDLTLLQLGGDVLDDATADRAVHALLAMLEEPAEFVARTTPTFLLDVRLMDTLAAVVRAASPHARRAVIDHLIEQPAQDDQAMATAWARVLHALPEGAWDQDTARRAGERAADHHWALSWPLLGLAANYDPVARDRLVNAARDRSLYALDAFGDVRALPMDVVVELVDVLAQQAEQTIRDAHAGTFHGGGRDIGHALALLNAWHLSAARWDPLLALLEDPLVSGNDKHHALRLLSSLVEQLPGDVRGKLVNVAKVVATRPLPADIPWFGNANDATGAAADLAAALGALNNEESAERMLDLLTGDARSRHSAARLAQRLARSEDTGILAVLAQDSDPDVRAAAAGGLASLVAADSGGALAATSLQRCLHDPGTHVPRAIAIALTKAPTQSPAARRVIALLRGHASAHVRSTLNEAESALQG